MMRRLRLSRSERGSATLEVLVLTPVLFILTDIGLYAGQMRLAHSTVRTAAQDAIRYVTTDRDTFSAHFDSFGAAGAIASAQGMSCGAPSFSWLNPIDPFTDIPPGQPAMVTASMTCKIPIRVIGNLGTAKYVTITEYATTVLDTYRNRQ